MKKFELNVTAQRYLKLAHAALNTESEAAAAANYRAALAATQDVQGLRAIADDMTFQLDHQVEAGWNSNVPWALYPDRLALTNEALKKAVDLATTRGQIDQILGDAKLDSAFDAGQAAKLKRSQLGQTTTTIDQPSYNSFVRRSWNR